MNKKTAFHFVSEMPSMIPFLNRRFFYNDNMKVAAQRRIHSRASFVRIVNTVSAFCACFVQTMDAFSVFKTSCRDDENIVLRTPVCIVSHSGHDHKKRWRIHSVRIDFLRKFD